MQASFRYSNSAVFKKGKIMNNTTINALKIENKSTPSRFEFYNLLQENIGLVLREKYFRTFYKVALGLRLNSKDNIILAQVDEIMGLRLGKNVRSSLLLLKNFELSIQTIKSLEDKEIHVVNRTGNADVNQDPIKLGVYK